jgi:hypothetical protein
MTHFCYHSFDLGAWMIEQGAHEMTPEESRKNAGKKGVASIQNKFPRGNCYLLAAPGARQSVLSSAESVVG